MNTCGATKITLAAIQELLDELEQSNPITGRAWQVLQQIRTLDP
jgi:hypothetical protein